MLHIPLSLYIHIPWCIKKCPYCDFNSHALNTTLPEQEYLNALIEDLKHDLPLIQNRKISTIFIGGGTPSLISPNGIEWLLKAISNLVVLDTNTEITLEVNPGTIEHHNLQDYYNAGINRVSLGVQSFDNNKLKILGRIHQSKDTIKVIEQLHKVKFNSFNLDLMHGLPNQSVTEGILDLKTALSFNPPHLSWYQLTLEPNTVFYKFPPKMPSDDITWEIQQQGEIVLAEKGFKHYEVSAFARAEHACRHNINYWSFGDYLGIGAGAHAKITNLANHRIQRFWKNRNPKDYLDRDIEFLAGSRTLVRNEIASEFMLNRLRLFTSFNIQEYTDQTGLPISDIAEILSKAQKQGLLEITEDNNQSVVSVTSLGKRFLNNLMEMFLTEEVTNA